MNITVNGKPNPSPDDIRLDALVRVSTGHESTVGIAVAVNGHVIPQNQWTATPLHEGDSVEILQAVAGG